MKTTRSPEKLVSIFFPKRRFKITVKKTGQEYHGFLRPKFSGNIMLYGYRMDDSRKRVFAKFLVDTLSLGQVRKKDWKRLAKKIPLRKEVFPERFLSAKALLEKYFRKDGRSLKFRFWKIGKLLFGRFSLSRKTFKRPPLVSYSCGIVTREEISEAVLLDLCRRKLQVDSVEEAVLKLESEGIS